MLKLLSTVVGRPVLSQRDGRRLTAVTEVIGDADTAKVVAYRVGNGLISTADVTAYLDEGVVVADDEAIRPEDELVRVARLGDRRTGFIGLRAVTEQGRRLGTVDDVLIETEGHFVTRLHIRPPFPFRWFSGERIVPRERVVRMDARRAVVRYDDKAPVSAEPEIAQ